MDLMHKNYDKQTKKLYYSTYLFFVSLKYKKKNSIQTESLRWMK